MSATRTVIAGRYRLGDQLGSGGMGVVWEAYDELLHRTVAVKEVRYPSGISEEERERLARRTLREARAVAAVEDPHAVRVFDIVDQDGRPWIVMELVRGRTLTDVVRERGALPVAEVARIGLALVDALEAAHRAGVLHRDVKPSNVLLGDDGRVALTDFGIATVDTDPSDVTTTGQVVGSPAYMAPERARGEQPTPAADLWSLGATLWTAAEGRAPYDGGNALATMTKVVSEPPPPCGRCAGPLGEVLLGLMERDPTRRPSTGDTRTRLAEVLRRPQEPEDNAYPAGVDTTATLRPQFDRTMALEARVVDEAVAVPATAEPVADSRPPAPAEPAVADPGPPSPPHGPVPSARRSDDSRRVWPLAVAVLAVLALGGVAAALLLGGSSSPSRSAAHHPKASATPTHPASSAPTSTSSTPAGAALPSGWHRYTDPSLGWVIGVPSGWQVQRSGGSVFLRDPAGGRYLQMATRYPAGASAVKAWEDQEQSFASSHSAYHRIRIQSVSWRGFGDVADWEFTYDDGGAALHAVDRAVVVGKRGYGLFFQTHAADWSGSQQLMQQLFATFSPG